MQFSDLCCSATRTKYRGKPEHCKHFMLRRTTLVGNPYSRPGAGRAGAAGGPPMRAFHADQQPLALPPGHTFPATKYRRLRTLVEAWPELEVREAAAGGGRDPHARPRRSLRGGDRRQRAERGRAAGDRLSLERGDGGACPSLGRGDARRGPHRARRRDRRQSRRRHPSCERRPGQRLLRLQRCRGRRARRAGGCGACGRQRRRAAHRRHRPRRPPGRRHRLDLRRRPERLHGVAARREELPLPQGGERSRRRPARRLRRRRLSRRARRGLGGHLARARGCDRSAWPSISPAPTRTRTTGSAA